MPDGLARCISSEENLFFEMAFMDHAAFSQDPPRSDVFWIAIGCYFMCVQCCKCVCDNFLRFFGVMSLSLILLG
jgi:hypothetical protein